MQVIFNNVNLVFANSKKEYLCYSKQSLNESSFIYTDDNKIYVSTTNEFFEIYAYPIAKGNTYTISSQNITGTAGNTIPYSSVILGVVYADSIEELQLNSVLTGLVPIKTVNARTAWTEYTEKIIAERNGYLIVSNVKGTYKTVVKTNGNDGVSSVLDFNNPLFVDSFVNSNGNKESYNMYNIYKTHLNEGDTIIIKGSIGNGVPAITTANTDNSFPVIPIVICSTSDVTTITYTAEEDIDILLQMSINQFHQAYVL